MAVLETECGRVGLIEKRLEVGNVSACVSHRGCEKKIHETMGLGAYRLVESGSGFQRQAELRT